MNPFYLALKVTLISYHWHGMEAHETCSNDNSSTKLEVVHMPQHAVYHMRVNHQEESLE